MLNKSTQGSSVGSGGVKTFRNRQIKYLKCDKAAEKEMSGEHRFDKTEVGGSTPFPCDLLKFQRFGLRWAESVGLPECPYLTRWVITVFGYSIRLHHWHASDDQRYAHDHAWNYVACILKGGYLEHMEGLLSQYRTAGTITFYKAEHRHRVQILKGTSCWSLLFTGRPRRDWGFYVPGREKLLRPLRYFSRYGHHPCE